MLEIVKWTGDEYGDSILSDVSPYPFSEAELE
jgi:hypothetical protein